MSKWLYKNKIVTDLPENAFGFVYKITNTNTGMKYIGRKYARTMRRKPLTKKQKLAGRTRRDVIRAESNWREYTGSNIKLNDDIKLIGIENFKFEIIIYGQSKGQVNFLEETVSHKLNVLLDDSYYNDNIGPGRFITIKKDPNLLKKLVELFG